MTIHIDPSTQSVSAGTKTISMRVCVTNATGITPSEICEPTNRSFILTIVDPCALVAQNSILNNGVMNAVTSVLGTAKEVSWDDN
jgi:hypothetical protein